MSILSYSQPKFKTQRLEAGTSKGWMALLAFGVTDETFSVATLRREQKFSPQFMFGLNAIAFSAWNVGTWIGVFLSTAMGLSSTGSLGSAVIGGLVSVLLAALRLNIILECWGEFSESFYGS